VRHLLDKSADVEVKATGWLGRGQTRPSYAAANGREAVVQLLLDECANLEAKDEGGQTPLCYAISNRHEAVVRLLFDRGANVEAKDARWGQTPLVRAAKMVLSAHNRVASSPPANTLSNLI